MNTSTALIALPLALVFALAPATAHAVPSTPATLPASDTLYAIECDDADGTIPSRQLFTVDSADATMLPIGSGTPNAGYCAYNAAVDSSTGTVYFIDWSQPSSSLSTIDVESGSSTLIDAFRDSTGENLIDVSAIAIQADGSAYAIAGGNLHTLDLATARVTPVGEPSGFSSSIWAFAADPVSGTLYAVEADGTPVLLVFDDETGAASILDIIPQGSVYSMAFDSAGTLWLTNNYELATVTVTDWLNTYEPVGSTTLANNPTYGNYFTESLFILPAAVDEPEVEEPEATQPEVEQPEAAQPELAETGADPVVTASLSAAGVLMLLAGVVALMLQRRGRRSTV